MKRYNFPRLDIAKIDIEGAESIVFAVHKQAVRVQDWLPKVNMLTLEIHPWFAHHYFGQDKLFEKVCDPANPSTLAQTTCMCLLHVMCVQPVSVYVTR